jgi:hypothetical protein
MKRQIFVCVIALFATVHVSAAKEIRLTSPDAALSDYVHIGAMNYRLGKRVVFHFINGVKDRFWNVSTYLATCDGKILQGPIVLKNLRDVSTHSEALRAFLRSDAVTQIPIHLNETEFGPDIWNPTKQVRPHLPSICANAAPEPRNRHIPIAEADGSVFHILSGTAQKHANKVLVWINESDYIMEKYVFPSITGEPGDPGIPTERRKFTGKKKLARVSIDCQARKNAYVEYLDYSETGTVVNRISLKPNEVQYSSIVPGSVGEAQLDFVCNTYH